ncbi:MAG: serine/threonine protein kinase, partial [Gaiellaceae bacterium]
MPERTIASRYTLLEQLDGGSHWRAEDTELRREVVVRLLGPHEPTSPAVHLTHPNVVHVFDHGESDGERFEVLEYVGGESLGRRLERGPLSETQAQELAQDVAAALAYAHGQGIAHGALGIDSVLLDPDGCAKVTG